MQARQQWQSEDCPAANSWVFLDNMEASMAASAGPSTARTLKSSIVNRGFSNASGICFWSLNMYKGAVVVARPMLTEGWGLMAAT